MTSEPVVEPKDVVEDVIELVDDTSTLVQTNNTFRYVGLALVVGSTAAYISYYITKKRLKEKYAEISKQEIEEARAYYARMAKPATPAELAARYADEQAEQEEEPLPDSELAEVRRITASYQSTDVEEARATLEETVDQPAASVTRNVFEMADPGTDEFDYEEEQKHRSEEDPYILSHDEFMASEKDYQQVQFTYYEGDDVLCDEKDQVVEDEDSIVGAANLLRFGHGSKDRNIVYIRNDRLQLEFEVCRSDGKYAEQVLGFIEHSDDDRRPRKFRVNRDD